MTSSSFNNLGLTSSIAAPSYCFTKALSSPPFLAAWVLLIILSYRLIDLPLAIYIHQFNNSLVHEIGHWITMMGLGGINLLAAGMTLVLGFILRSRKLIMFAVFWIIALLVSGAICDILKYSLGRARPTQWFHHERFGFYFMQFKSSMSSLPSGHAVIISASMTALSLYWPRWRYFCFFILLMVCASRLVLEHHYLSDVLSGVLIGSLITFWLYQTVSKLPIWRNLSSTSK